MNEFFLEIKRNKNEQNENYKKAEEIGTKVNDKKYQIMTRERDRVGKESLVLKRGKEEKRRYD